jgi:general secretion pathway protein D
LAEKLVEDLDKARPEVIVDIAVMQVSKDKSRTLGLSPPTSATITLQDNINTTSTTTGTTNSGAGGTVTSTTGTQGINLNTLGNLNATNFQVTIPSANLSAVMSASDTKLIQNPQIRALDGQKASLKIGDRVPVATGSFQPGIGGVGINPLVNTQFQYLDVGVNVDVTPYVHAGGEVTLKLSLEISSVTGVQNIGGFNQPTIGQRRIEHEARLKDGEVNLIAGLLNDTETSSMSGYPGLIHVPVAKYLFGQETKEKVQSEIVFAIIPHIVRSNEINDDNLKEIDLGAGNSVTYRKAGTK